MNADTIHRTTTSSAPPVDPPGPLTEPPVEPVEPVEPAEPAEPAPMPPDPFPDEPFPNDPDTPHAPDPEPDPGGLPPSRPPFQMP